MKKSGELENTIIVITSDNGMPFPRCKATLYDLGVKVPLAVKWHKKFKAGRAVTDFVYLHDFAPTFLDLAGVDIPPSMNGKSLKNILFSDKSGRVESDRSSVVVGMERHVECNPQRALRTDRYLLIRNYYQNKWPVAKSDYNYNIDPSPSKTYIQENKDDPKVKPFYDLAFAARGEFELYDLKNDPDQVRNLANEAGFQEIKQELLKQMKAKLEAADDPRVFRKGNIFEHYRSKDKKK